MNSAVVKTL